MKKYLSIILALVMCLSLFAGCAGEPAGNDTTPATQGSEPAPSTNDKPLAGTYDIKVWVAENIVELTKSQITKFNETNDQGIVINATVEPVGEGDAATAMTNDVEAGADLFGFAQDQAARLITAGALQQLGAGASEWVKANNDADAIVAASAGDAFYAYPMTSDNGYFMYYDKSVIPEEAVGSLEALIAACEEAGRNFSFEVENGWYIPSFFFATGCVSEWQMDEEGKKFVSVNDNFNSEAGIVAATALQKLVTSSSFVNSSQTADFSAAVPSAIVVSGTWNYANAKSQLGENFGVAILPSFEVEGKTYQLSGFKGCKLIGIKPQTDALKAAALNQLAQYLTGFDCQMERLTNENVGWGPSNLQAQQTEEFKNAPHLIAMYAQKAFARPQGQIHGSWWDISAKIAKSIKEGTEIETALATYQSEMEALFTMDDSVLKAWTVIGAIAGTNWDTDLTMTEQADGTWKSDEAYEINDTTEFKVRQGKSWDVNWGVDYANGNAPKQGGDNVKLDCLGVEAGTYFIVLDPATGVISVVAA